MENAIEIRELYKQYQSGPMVLNGINLNIMVGNACALLGRNGAGKSTLIGSLCSLIKPNRGKISLLGYDLSKHPSYAKQRLGIIPQEFNFSIFESLINTLIYQAGCFGIPRKVALARAEQRLKEVNLWERRHSPVRSLSGGMKRKLMFARALINNPKLLILDEPTANVDIETRNEIWSSIQKLITEGTTLLLTTHNLQEAETLCSHVAVLNQGKIQLNSSMQNLLAQSNIDQYIIEFDEPPAMDKHPSAFGKLEPITNQRYRITMTQNESIEPLLNSLKQHGIPFKGIRYIDSNLELIYNRILESSDDQT